MSDSFRSTAQSCYDSNTSVFKDKESFCKRYTARVFKDVAITEALIYSFVEKLRISFTL
jgi:hypothetical protein